MRLKRNKTWSQHQLAIKLRVEQKEKAGLLSWEHRRLLIHACKDRTGGRAMLVAGAALRAA